MNTRRYRKIGFFRIANTFVSVITLFFFSTASVFALPGGQQVVNGQVTFSTQGNNLTITNSPNAIINWQGFSINSNEAVRFIQQYDTSAVLNRVLGQDPSQILGILQSNGRVFLVNPNGILVGKGAKIDTNGFFASTLDISNLDFMGGKYNFKAGLFAGSIENQGTITTPAGGKVYLIAPNVANSGIINTPQGEVLLAAGHSVQLVDSHDTNIAVVISAPENKAVNLGQIIARSGKVGIYGGMIAQKGIVNADKAAVGANGKILFKAVKDITLGAGSLTSAQGGDIRILGGKKDGTVNVAGTIDASAPKGGNGGFIETSAAKVKISDSAVITTLAPYGKTGTWFIDPTNFTIAASGGDMTGTNLSNSLSFNNVTILSSNGATEGNGDIFVNDNITWSANKLTLDAYRNIEINRELFGSGAAQLALYYGQGTVASGNTAKYSVNAPVNLPSGNNFSTKLGSDGTEITYSVINDLASLQNISSNLGGYYALGGSIDASETSIWNPNGSGGYFGFSPIGDSSTAFTGTFDGLGHTITGLYINRPATKYVGLFGYTYGSSIIQNVGLIDASVTGQNYVGGLAGWNYSGSISSSYITGAVTGTGDYVGGLIGWNYEGNIGTTYNTCAVSGTGYVGGLLGYNHSGSVSNSYSTGAVTGTGDYAGGLIGWNYEGDIATSYGTGSVSGKSYTGGLAGYNYSGSVSNSYSTGAVTGTGAYAGGLIGWNYEGDIANSYSTGSVRGRSMVGGLVGDNYSGNIKNSFWDITTSGQTTSAGGRGMTTADFMNKANFTSARAANGNVNPGWNFSNTWYMIDGNTRPFMRMEYSTNITNAHQLQLMALNLGASYTLANNIDMSELKQASGMWNTSTGFVPIGDSSTKFTGTFDGLGHTITGLYINRPATNYGGLFGYTQSSSVIQNVGLLNANITGQDYVGGLVGYNDFGTISNSYNTGIVTGMSNVGGIVGYNQVGSISNSYSTGAVKGMNNVGGLVGYNFFGRINNTYYDIENVLINGAHYVTIGGLYASQYQNWVDGGYAALDVANYGASLPYNSDGSYYTVTTTQGLKDMLAFLNMGYTFKLGNNIDLNGLPDWHLPVFNGTFDGAGYTLSNLTVNQPFNDIIGFIGRNDSGTLINVGLVNVSITGNDNVGGLVGYNFGGTISNSYSTGKVNGSSSVGGLIGYLSGAISNSYNTGTVNGTNNVGGLVGFNVGFAISNSYNTGTVTGSGIYIGGLVGRNGFHGKINDAYNTGAVIGTNDAGGLVGFNSGAISNSYNTGAVTGTSSIGGLVGYNTNRGTVTNSFWDITTSGQTNSAGGRAITTADFMNKANFTSARAANGNVNPGWDFDTTWWMSEGNTRPFLRSEWSTNITNAHQLQLMALNLGASYTLASNIDMSELKRSSGMWNTSTGFVPLGDSTTAFTGTFDGLGHTIAGLYVNRPATDYVGFFGYTQNSSVIQNVGLIDVDVTGQNYVGGLVGANDSNGAVSNSYSTGNVTGDSFIGGLVGVSAHGTINNSYSTSTVTGNLMVGGLVGYNYGGSISNSYSTGVVNSSGDYVGSLVGVNKYNGTISNSYSTGSVSGRNYLGGLVGENGDFSTVSNSYSMAGSVVGTGNNIGGLVGSDSGTIKNSYYNIDNVLINGARHVTKGGLYDLQYQDWVNNNYRELNIANYNTSLAYKSDGGYYTVTTAQGLKDMLAFLEMGYTFKLGSNIDLGDLPDWHLPVFSGTFDGSGYTLSNMTVNQSFNDDIGFIGRLNTGTVTGLGLINVSVVGHDSVGALVGYNYYGTINNTNSTGTVTGADDFFSGVVGGLVGYNYIGSISNSYSTSTVTGRKIIGGLVGANYNGAISNSYSTGSVTGTGHEVGGLVGDNQEGIISYSYSTGDVNGMYHVGGLVGYNHIGGWVTNIDSGTISYSYSAGNVSGTNRVGGLVGLNGGTISNSYSTGAVTGTGDIGGLVGVNDRTITNSFWDVTTSGQSTSAGGMGMTTADFMNKENFTSATAANGNVNPGWDFNSTWWMSEGNTRPFLRMEYSTNITNAHQLQLMALNLGASYTLANNIDMSELTRASGMWNTSTGFVPIGTAYNSPFTGNLDGQGYTITGLYINRPATDYVGLFGYTGSSSAMQNIGLIDDDITGQNYVGGLLGINNGSIINAYGTGTVSGSSHIGGLVAWNDGTISNSYTTGNVTGTSYIGGLAGYNSGNINASYNMGPVTGLSYVGGLVGRNLYDGTIRNSYSTGAVTGTGIYIGGLVGHNYTGTVSNSYSTGEVSGGSYVGGLVGYNENGTINNSYNTGMVNGTGYHIGGLVGSGRSVSNSYYDIDNVLINGAYYVTEGGLYASQYRDWVNNSYKALNIANYGTSLPYTSDARSGYYTVTTLQGLRDMLAFLDKGYTFKLGNDINLVGLPDWHLPVFNGTFDGSGYTLTNLTVYQPFNSYIGFIGRMNNGTIINLGLINASVTGHYAVGGLAGSNNYGTIHNSYSTGNVSGSDGVGGLVGHNEGTIRYAFSTGIVSGMYNVGGLVGSVSGGNISNSYSTGNVTGTDCVGGLVGNTYSGSIDNSYSTGNVTGRKYVGGLVGYNYYGTIYDSNNTGNVAGTDYVGGLVGYAYNSRISNSYSTGNVTGREYVGGLVGYSLGYNYYSTIINSFNTGNVSGNYDVGGLVGWSQGSSIVEIAYNTGNVSGNYSVGGLVGWNSSGTINNSYNTGTVNGSSYVGGLVGENDNFGTISNTYSTGNVCGTNYAGGLVGINWGTVTNSFWNTSTAGVTNGIGVGTSAGATGLTTDQMMQSANFTGFDFTNTWRIYESHTTPLLRVFLKPLTITADDVVKVYDGTSVGLTNVAYSDSAAAGSSNLFGIATPYGSVVKNNVGVYSPDIWSNQQGYDITIGTQTGTYGTLTVTPRPVTVASIADVNTPYGTPAAAGAVRLDNVIVNDVVYATADIDNPVYNPGNNSLKANCYTQSTGTLSGADAPNYGFGGYTTPTANYVVEPGQIVSGMLNLATAGKRIYFVVNGTLLADQGITDANGNYSAMFPLCSIGSNSALLAYVANDSAVKSASVYAAAGGDISGLALYTNTLTAYSSGGTISNTTLGTARGSVTSDDIPFTVSGNDLSLMNGISFVTASGTGYLINGAITTLNGSQTYNGTVTLSGNTTLTASGTGGITFGGPVTGADDNLNATAGGDITVGGPINVRTGSVTLTASNGAIINGMGSARSITADSLVATAANGIGSGNPLTTGVHNLSAVNTVVNNIQISNTGSLAVGDMRNEGTGDIVLQNIGRTTTGSSTVTSAGGNVSITAHSPLTIGAGGVSAYRNITLVASPGGVSDDLTINGPLTASTGNINLTAGSLMVFGPEGSMSAPQGKSMLKDGGLISSGNKMAGNSTVISISKVITNIIMADDDRASEDEDLDQNED